MNLVKALFLGTAFSLSVAASAQDGCFFPQENNYLGVGALRYDQLCTKLADGNYVWVTANEFDMGGGCWSVDKYPVGAIVEMGDLRKCVYENGGYSWGPYTK